MGKLIEIQQNNYIESKLNNRDRNRIKKRPPKHTRMNTLDANNNTNHCLVTNLSVSLIEEDEDDKFSSSKTKENFHIKRNSAVVVNNTGFSSF